MWGRTTYERSEGDSPLGMTERESIWRAKKRKAVRKGRSGTRGGHGPRRNNAGARQMMVGKAEEIAREGPGQIKK